MPRSAGFRKKKFPERLWVTRTPRPELYHVYPVERVKPTGGKRFDTKDSRKLIGLGGFGGHLLAIRPPFGTQHAIFGPAQQFLWPEPRKSRRTGRVRVRTPVLDHDFDCARVPKSAGTPTISVRHIRWNDNYSDLMSGKGKKKKW